MADLIAPLSEVGDLHPLVDAAPDELGRTRKPADRLGDGAGEKDRQENGDKRHETEGEEHDLALGLENIVDLSAGRRKHKGAQHGAEALNRNHHRDDNLAPVIHPDDADRSAVESRIDFGKVQ